MRRCAAKTSPNWPLRSDFGVRLYPATNREGGLAVLALEPSYTSLDLGGSLDRSSGRGQDRATPRLGRWSFSGRHYRSSRDRKGNSLADRRDRASARRFVEREDDAGAKAGTGEGRCGRANPSKCGSDAAGEIEPCPPSELSETRHPPTAPRVPRVVRGGVREDRVGGARGARRTRAPHGRGLSRGSPSRSP